MTRQAKSYDGVLLALGFMALVVEVTLLLAQMRVIHLPLPYLNASGDGPRLGHLLRSETGVHFRRNQSLTWYPMVEGDGILERDSLLVGSAGEATVLLEGVGELRLEPQSLVFFAPSVVGSKEVFRFEIRSGRARFQNHNGKAKVATGHKVLEIAKNSIVSIEAAPASQTAKLEVKQGSLEMKQEEAPTRAPASVVTVRAGESAEWDSKPPAVTQDAPLKIIPRPLQVTATQPSPEEVVFLTPKGVELAWNWKEKVDDASTRQLEWALEGKNWETLPLDSKQRSVFLTPPPGKILWRLKQDERQSETFSFLVREMPTYETQVAAKGSLPKEGKPFELRWSKQEGAENYRVEVATDEFFRHIVFQTKTSETSIAVKGLGSGKYFWRVQALGQARFPASAPQPLRIKGRLAPPVPRGTKVKPSGFLAPPRGVPGIPGPRPKKFRMRHIVGSLSRVLVEMFSVPSAYAAEKPVVKAPEIGNVFLDLSWESIPGARKYRVQIAEDLKFKNVLQSVDTQGNSDAGSTLGVTLETKARPEFYWRVAAFDSDGDLGHFSAPTRVDSRKVFATLVEVQRAKVAEIQKVKMEEAQRAKNEAAAAQAAKQAEEKARATPPKPFFPTSAYDHRPFGVESLSLFAGGTFLMQINPGTVSVSAMGVVPSSFGIEVHLGLRAWDLVLRSLFQPRVYVNQIAAINDFQSNLSLMHMDHLLQLSRDKFPWTVGVHVRTEPRFSVAAVEALALTSEIYGALAFGRMWNWSLSERWGLYLSVMPEIAPLGVRKGGSMLTRARFVYRSSWWKPFAELGWYPQGRLGASGNLEIISELGLIVGASF